MNLFCSLIPKPVNGTKDQYVSMAIKNVPLDKVLDLLVRFIHKYNSLSNQSFSLRCCLFP